MKELLVFLVQVHIGIALLYLVYRFLLNNQTTFIVKRIYLLGALIIVFLLPFVHFEGTVNQSLDQIGTFFQFYENAELIKLQFLSANKPANHSVSIGVFSAAFSLYFVIALFLYCKVFFDLIKIKKSINRNKTIKRRNLHFVIDKTYSSPFSFFNYLFTKSVHEIEKTPEYIHELAHVKQFHSIDRLLVELSIPLLWVNPFIYLIRKSMIEVHEHLADSEVIRNGVEPVVYQKYLYLQLKSGRHLQLTSNFNYSLTKKRIMMISNKISIKQSVARTILSTIIVAGIIIFYGCNNHEIVVPISSIQKKLEKSVQSDSVPAILPLKEGGEYWIGSQYGMRKHPILKVLKFHEGMDIVAPTGTEIIAPADGLVIESEWKNAYGNRIKIKHAENFVTVYAHLSGLNVKVGDIVKTKDVIGYVGSTGLSTLPHLHYEVIKDGKSINPADFIKNVKEFPEKEKTAMND